MKAEFQLNQASLQDFQECRRRFYLRHVLKINWPGHQTDQMEQQQLRIQQGIAFHRLVHQHIIGLPEDRLSAIASETGLDRWWQSYLQHPIPDLHDKVHAETSLSAPVADHRLVAKYDLVIVGPEVQVVDWKTSKRRSEAWLKSRMQTRIYQYLMVLAGGDLNGSIEPEQLVMIYWFADDPRDPVQLSYSKSQFEQDGQDLLELIEEIQSLEELDF